MQSANTTGVKRRICISSVLLSSMLLASGCATGQYEYGNDIYNHIYTNPPASTLNQQLPVFSEGNLL